jgi:DNA-directed RNA polymerase subunit RPC12/RpoP
MIKKRFKLYEHELFDSNEGHCINCGAQAFAVEPDARKYKCETCGANAVYGNEQLLIAGLVDIIEEEHDCYNAQYD